MWRQFISLTSNSKYCCVMWLYDMRNMDLFIYWGLHMNLEMCRDGRGQYTIPWITSSTFHGQHWGHHVIEASLLYEHAFQSKICHENHFLYTYFEYIKYSETATNCERENLFNSEGKWQNDKSKLLNRPKGRGWRPLFFGSSFKKDRCYRRFKLHVFCTRVLNWSIHCGYSSFNF